MMILRSLGVSERGLFQIEECSETESTVRLHDRSLNGGGHVAHIACICHVQVSVFICFVWLLLVLLL